MKTQFLLLSIMLLFSSLWSCEKNTTSIVASNDTYTKEVIASDATGKFNVKLKVSTTDQDLLSAYNNKSFTLTLVIPTPSTTEGTPSSVVTEQPASSHNAVTVEIVESSIPEGTPFLLTLNKLSVSGAKLAARMITMTLLGTAPNTYIYVYNQGSGSMTVSFSYATDLKLNNWISGGVKTLGPRKDASYCRLGIKGIRAIITYDASLGTYSYFVWQKYSC